MVWFFNAIHGPSHYIQHIIEKEERFQIIFAKTKKNREIESAKILIGLNLRTSCVFMCRGGNVEIACSKVVYYVHMYFKKLFLFFQGSGAGSKVEVEIQKFQREIEKANMEKSKVNNWHERRKKSRSASTDSLLSMDEGSDHSSGINIVPTLPPKGRFLSTDNLSPPKLPPKQNIVSS